MTGTPVTGTDETEDPVYEITYLGTPGGPVTCRVAAGEVAGVIAQAGRDGARVLVRPCASSRGGQQTTAEASGGRDA
ncbi:hypothetical protein [Streptomyces sp. NPDC090445]|uniref:hypothetical protein n=1 Tax=Streptomyces sp. NPDC090445 TaxID=3365963 RepID=UPI003801D770